MFFDYHVNMTDNFTILLLVFKIFLSKYYNNNIRLLTKWSIYRNIKRSYFRDITEVYKPYDEDSYYYNMNYFYLYVALQDISNNKCIKKYYFDKYILLNNCFRFYYYKIDTLLNSYFGLVLVISNNNLYFPVSKWYGWYFSQKFIFPILPRQAGAAGTRWSSIESRGTFSPAEMRFWISRFYYEVPQTWGRGGRWMFPKRIRLVRSLWSCWRCRSQVQSAVAHCP